MRRSDDLGLGDAAVEQREQLGVRRRGAVVADRAEDLAHPGPGAELEHGGGCWGRGRRDVARGRNLQARLSTTYLFSLFSVLLVIATFAVTLFVTSNVTIQVVVLEKVGLIRSRLPTCCGSGLGAPALLFLLAPRVQRALGDHSVVQPAVVALDEAVKRFATDGAPSLDVTAVPGELRQGAVVDGQARGRQLVPTRTPQQQRGAEALGAAARNEVGVAQPHDLERKPREVAQVDVRGHERRRPRIRHACPFAARSAKPYRQAFECHSSPNSRCRAAALSGSLCR